MTKLLSLLVIGLWGLDCCMRESITQREKSENRKFYHRGLRKDYPQISPVPQIKSLKTKP